MSPETGLPFARAMANHQGMETEPLSTVPPVEAEEVWIGLFEVTPRPGTTNFDAAGAFVQIVAPAVSESEYVARALAALADVGFDAVEWEDVYPLGPDWPPHDAHPSLVAAVAEARKRNHAAWGDWHLFPHEDESA
jgi:hypothetical protein